MKGKFEYVSHSPEETELLAKKLGELVAAGDVITLSGDLGVGKTSFTKGLAKGLGITRTVSSPTFTIIKEYIGRLPLYHMDAYRIEDEWEELGLDEYFHGEGVSVIEWPDMIGEQLPENRLVISIERIGDTRRKIKFQPLGEHYIKICEELFKDECISD